MKRFVNAVRDTVKMIMMDRRRARRWVMNVNEGNLRGEVPRTYTKCMRPRDPQTVVGASWRPRVDSNSSIDCSHVSWESAWS